MRGSPTRSRSCCSHETGRGVILSGAKDRVGDACKARYSLPFLSRSFAPLRMTGDGHLVTESLTIPVVSAESTFCPASFTCAESAVTVRVRHSSTCAWNSRESDATSTVDVLDSAPCAVTRARPTAALSYVLSASSAAAYACLAETKCPERSSAVPKLFWNTGTLLRSSTARASG